jgi:acyl carrier protein
MQLTFENLQQDIAGALDVLPNELAPTTVLKGNEKWDSFAMLTVVALITENTGKQITLQDISKLTTVSDLVGLFQKLKDD